LVAAANGLRKGAEMTPRQIASCLYKFSADSAQAGHHIALPRVPASIAEAREQAAQKIAAAPVGMRDRLMRIMDAAFRG
jgi:hypothetical protein